MRPGVVILLIVALSAYCVFLGSSLIAWKTKKQTAVSRSSAEAELRAMAAVTTEVTWLQWLLEDFGVMASTPTPLSSDSTGAISIALDLVKHKLTKHIGVDAYMRLQVHDEIVALQYVPSEFQLADFFMNAQAKAQHNYFLSKHSVRCIHTLCILSLIWGAICTLYIFIFAPLAMVKMSCTFLSTTRCMCLARLQNDIYLCSLLSCTKIAK